MPSISLVIPNYNGIRFLPTCLDSVQVTVPDEIIVVDDGSTDGSAALVREHYPSVTCIALDRNSGFCHAANTGLAAARGELVALLNNDVEVESHWLAELAAVLDKNPGVGFCASKMLFYDQRDCVNSAGLFMRLDGVGRDIGFGQPDGPEFSQVKQVFGASGGAAIYRRALLDQVGLLDESLVAYGEDLDLAFRARWLGWSCLFVPSAIVYHRVGATYQPESALKAFLSSRNMLTVVLKDMPTALLRRYALPILAAQLYQVLHLTARGQGIAAVRGKVAALRALRETLAKRRQIQSSRSVDDAQIVSQLESWNRHGRLDPAYRR
jgi:GT2 family glycosyltransferase